MPISQRAPAKNRVLVLAGELVDNPSKIDLLGGSFHLVSGLVHPSSKWDVCRVNPLISTSITGDITHLRAVGSSPPSRYSCPWLAKKNISHRPDTGTKSSVTHLLFLRGQEVLQTASFCFLLWGPATATLENVGRQRGLFPVLNSNADEVYLKPSSRENRYMIYGSLFGLPLIYRNNDCLIVWSRHNSSVWHKVN